MMLKTEKIMSDNFHEQAKVALTGLQVELVAITEQVNLLVERRKKVQAQYQGLKAFITATDSVASSVDDLGGASRIASVPLVDASAGGQREKERHVLSPKNTENLNAQGVLRVEWPSTRATSTSSSRDIKLLLDAWQTSTQPSSLKDAVLSVVEKCLADGKPHPTKELVEELQAQGVVISGADPVITVSSILSREKDKFLADRKHGWSLK